MFDVIAELEPSGRGELEITDVNNHYVRAGTLEFDVFEGYWGDAGESIDAYYEVIERVRQTPFHVRPPAADLRCAASRTSVAG